MATEDGGQAGTPRVRLALFIANFAAIVTLTLTGASLRSGLSRFAPDAATTFGWAIMALLACAFAGWVIVEGRRVPVTRLALACTGVVAMLAWAWTIHFPSERMHLLLFGTFGVTAPLALGLRAGLCCALAYAGIDEFVQLQLPERVADWQDVALNAASVTAGWLVVLAQRGAAPRPLESGDR